MNDIKSAVKGLQSVSKFREFNSNSVSENLLNYFLKNMK